MNEINSIYDELWDSSNSKFKCNQFEFDLNLNNINDNRRGITLLARFSKNISEKVENFLKEGIGLEPKQYFYNKSDFHLTILSIISCRNNFTLLDFDKFSYIDLITPVLKKVKKIQIEYRGITASPSCIMIQGFPLDSNLDRIRKNLRDGFNRSGLENTIDSRYTIQSAHSTVIRFNEPLRNHLRFIQYLEKHRNTYFGKLEIKKIELVYNDWYQKRKNTVMLAEFQLNKNA